MQCCVYWGVWGEAPSRCLLLKLIPRTQSCCGELCAQEGEKGPFYSDRRPHLLPWVSRVRSNCGAGCGVRTCGLPQRLFEEDDRIYFLFLRTLSWDDNGEPDFQERMVEATSWFSNTSFTSQRTQIRVHKQNHTGQHSVWYGPLTQSLNLMGICAWETREDTSLSYPWPPFWRCSLLESSQNCLHFMVAPWTKEQQEEGS